MKKASISIAILLVSVFATSTFARPMPGHFTPAFRSTMPSNPAIASDKVTMQTAATTMKTDVSSAVAAARANGATTPSAIKAAVSSNAAVQADKASMQTAAAKLKSDIAAAKTK